MSCEQTTFFHPFVKMQREKKLRLQTQMSLMILINLIVLMTNSSRHSQSFFLVKRFFSEPRWVYSCLKSQKTISDYYFNSNNCYNCELPRDTWMTSQGEKCYLKVWNLKYEKDIPLKMYGVYSLLLSHSTREPNFIYKMHICKLN